MYLPTIVELIRTQEGNERWSDEIGSIFLCKNELGTAPHLNISALPFVSSGHVAANNADPLITHK